MTKPIGGGKYNQTALENEAFNFLPHDGELLGYFQPELTFIHQEGAPLAYSA